MQAHDPSHAVLAELTSALAEGERLTRAGEDRAAVAWYNKALTMAPRINALTPELIDRLRRAQAASRAAAERFQAHLRASISDAGIDLQSGYPRFAEALDLLEGTKQPQLQQPSSFYFPRLPQIGFFEPDQFDWVAEIEAAAPAMRAEVEAVLATDNALVPYVQVRGNRPAPANSLLDDARWSAFHLWTDGVPVEENARRCPRTLAMLATAPMPRIRGRSPMALFSILKGGTHIAPHYGMLNTRLICHIPLIVPPGCRLRVGNEVREVEEGRALIFDDSIEHEAWNDSASPRAILLFEVWRPELTTQERAALTRMFEAITDYSSPG